MDHEPDPRFAHHPVMADEIVALFAPVADGWLVDATLGGAGHSRALLDAHPGLSVLGIDQDPTALAAATERLAPHGDRVRTVRARFDALAAVVADTIGAAPVVGVLFDLGVSSPQLDRPERGFSYRHDAPLDMRMDPGSARSAAQVVNDYPLRRLTAVLREHGDERFAARIARAVVAARPITTTGQLAEVVRDAIPAPARRTGGHPAKRTFQAIRIEVNEELAILPASLDRAIELLAPGGRLAVLAYHSGEDRIVKDRFRAATDPTLGLPRHLPIPPERTVSMRLLTRKAVTATADEVETNPRATSARLRAVERLHEEP